MKARQLIGSATYGPEALAALFKAFDDAWDQLAPKFGTDQLAIEAARLKLANIILSLADPNGNDPEQLKNAALRIMAIDDKA